MGSESTEVAEPHGSPSKPDPQPEQEEVEEEVPAPVKRGRGKKRGSQEKEEEEGGARVEEGEGTGSKRPARERKTVERYTAVSPSRKTSASKAVAIEQGSGTQLKDIPNVAFKLSKRKVDDILQALHVLLFGRKANVHSLKRNISQFSGFVWTANEEKQKAKFKEKLDKFNKDKLVDLCEILDIQFPRATTKKEDITAKLLEFLESPHVTREVLLAENYKKNKKRRSRTKISQAASGDGDASSDKQTKKRRKRLDTKTKRDKKESSKAEDENDEVDGSDGSKDASSGEEDNNDLQEDNDHVKDEEEENEETEPEVDLASKKGSDDAPTESPSDEVKVKETILPVKETASTKSGNSSSRRVTKKAAPPVEDESEPAPDSKHGSTEEEKKTPTKATKKKATSVKNEEKKSSKKNHPVDASASGPSKCSKTKKVDEKKDQTKEKANIEEKKGNKKKDRSSQKVSIKGQGGKSKKSAGPSTEELHLVVSNILKEVDFNTATLADILKQLGAHFNMNLMDRKAEVKSIIEDVINNMTDDEDGDDEKKEDADEEESSGDGDE